MKNLVLIGLSGCGKTTFGKRLARRLRLPLLDTDVMIEQKTGRTIPDIFAAEGESGFRDIESVCAKEAAARDGAVISTGGGMVLREENMKALSQGALSSSSTDTPRTFCARPPLPTGRSCRTTGTDSFVSTPNALTSTAAMPTSSSPITAARAR